MTDMSMILHFLFSGVATAGFAVFFNAPLYLLLPAGVTGGIGWIVYVYLFNFTTNAAESKEILVEVDNTIGAKVGDHVEVSMDNMNVLKAAVMAYIIPLIALLVGTIGTYYILGAIGMTTGVEAISGLVGICLTIICYLYLKKNDKKFRDSREFIPVITRILIDL